MKSCAPPAPIVQGCRAGNASSNFSATRGRPPGRPSSRLTGWLIGGAGAVIHRVRRTVRGVACAQTNVCPNRPVSLPGHSFESTWSTRRRPRLKTTSWRARAVEHGHCAKACPSNQVGFVSPAAPDSDWVDPRESGVAKLNCPLRRRALVRGRTTVGTRRTHAGLKSFQKPNRLGEEFSERDLEFRRWHGVEAIRACRTVAEEMFPPYTEKISAREKAGCTGRINGRPRSF
jgi:hypothetical protein